MFVRLKRVEQELEASRDQCGRSRRDWNSSARNERAEIAREIHDELGQDAHQPAVRIGLARQHGDTDAAGAIETPLDVGARQRRDSIRKNVAVRLRQGVLDELGLVKTLRRSRGIQEAHGDPVPIRDESSTRHSVTAQQASLCSGSPGRPHERGPARAGIPGRGFVDEETERSGRDSEDNGRGITRTAVAKPGASGVIGMRERALALGGRLTLGGLRGKGTTLTVQIRCLGCSSMERPRA